MRIDTRRKIKRNRLVYIACVFFIFLNFGYKVLQDRDSRDIQFELGATEVHVDGSWVEWYTPIYWPFFTVLAFLVYRGPIRFQYDTEGDVMNLKVEDKVLFFLGRFSNKHYEFPKRKLIDWSMITLPFFRLLTVEIESKTGSIRTRRLPISYLSRGELKQLKVSLNKSKSLNKKFTKAGDSLREPNAQN